MASRNTAGSSWKDCLLNGFSSILGLAGSEQTTKIRFRQAHFRLAVCQCVYPFGRVCLIVRENWLLICQETDGPYMCPEPFRGQTAHPGHVLIMWGVWFSNEHPQLLISTPGSLKGSRWSFSNSLLPIVTHIDILVVPPKQWARTSNMLNLSPSSLWVKPIWVFVNPTFRYTCNIYNHIYIYIWV